jgi:hypothetical protein
MTRNTLGVPLNVDTVAFSRGPRGIRSMCLVSLCVATFAQCTRKKSPCVIDTNLYTID